MDSEFSNIKNVKHERVLMAAGIVGLVFIIMILLFIYSQNRYIRIDDIKPPIAKIEKQPFRDINITAKSAVIWDIRGQKFVYQKNEKDVWPLASLTKLMTTLAASELLPEESIVMIKSSDVDREEKAELQVGERWNLNDLISLTLLSSSNTGSRAIASVAGAFLGQGQGRSGEEVFVEYLNRRAFELGLKSTQFYNDSGLDVNEQHSGAYGSAQDIAILLDYIVKEKPELLEPTTHSKLKVVSNDNLVHNIKNTNAAVDLVPGILGSKTGFTDLAQGNLAVAFSPAMEGPFIAVVLGSTADGRFSDIEKLVSATLVKLAD